MDDLFDFTGPIKAISLWQPWASLIAAHVKRHETRSWSTAYRGPIAIHAAKTIDVVGAPHDLCIAVLGRNWERTVPIGMVVAVGQVTACLEARRAVAKGLTAADLAAGNFAPGRFAWAIDDVRSLRQPIPLVGRQGLFNWIPPADLADQLGDGGDHAAHSRLAGFA
jgi:hypothetical protein